MEYRQLGNSPIKVSEIALGTMTWGQQNTQEQAFQQLDMALDYGINFVDTAEMYAIPPTESSYGATETIIGHWLKARGKRDDIVLASKVVGQANFLPHIRGGNACLDRKNIEQALTGSLKRLQTDYLDLYQVHWPDRPTNFFGQLGYRHIPEEKVPFIPIEETLEILDELVKSGKVRHIGISNETPWGAMQYLHWSQEKKWARIVSIQNPYNLLNRTFEIGLAEIAHREKVGLLAYSPLGFGVLSGKYLGNKKPENARLSLFSTYQRYSNEQSIAATEAYVNLAQRHGLDPAQMAIAFVTSRPFLTSNIIGATTLAQLKSNIESSDLILSEEVLKEIEMIHNRYPNPAP